MNNRRRIGRNKRRQAGVTLIEMLVVVVIIAVFAAVVGPRLLNQGDKARVVVPMHKGELKRKTLRGIIQDLKISVEEFANLL